MFAISRLFVVMMLVVGSVMGASPTVTASVDANRVMVQDSFTWTITVQGSDAMPQIRLPDIDKLALLSGPMQSSSYTYVNGRMSGKKTLTYTFVALEAGRAVIPPAKVFLGDNSYLTKRLVVDIVASNQGQPKSKTNDRPVFLKAIPSKTSIFIGEPVSVKYKLYTKVGVYNYQVDKLPDAVGFWASEVEQSSQPRLVSEVFDGVRYNTAILKTVLYYPTRSGELVIDPLKTELEIEVKGNQRNRRLFNDPFFNDPFFSGTRKATRNFLSNPVKINVKQLPEPRPANFSGAVGKFQIRANLDTNAVVVNDAVGLNIVLSGYGNFESLRLPEFKAPEYIDVFKPERSESISIKNLRHQGNKKVTYLLVPREIGKLSFDPIKFTYFDLNTGKYVTRSSGKIQMMVYDAAGTQPLVTSGYSREEVALMRDDIRYIKAADDQFSLGQSSLFSTGFWSIHLLGIAATLGLFGYQFRMRQLQGNINLRRSVKAMREAKGKLRQAQKLTGNSSELPSLLHQCIVGFIGARLNAAENALDTTELISLLREKNISGEIVAESRHFLEGLTLDRFAPGAVQQNDEELIKQTQELLQRLGKVL
jgi:hypothetical protein